jgi:hypothetical protein
MIKVSVPTSPSDRWAQATEPLDFAEKSAMTNETELGRSQSLTGLSQKLPPVDLSVFLNQ